ncbi:hypothetical protein LguiB_021741 [Lonicera macranthoides]
MAIPFGRNKLCVLPHTTTSLQLPRNVLLSEADFQVRVQQISNVLENLSFPRDTHSLIIEEIYSNVILLESESWENYMRIRPILVEIGVVPFDVNPDIEELMMMDDDLIILDPLDEDEWSMVEVGQAGPAYKAASRSSIEELEKISARPILEGSSCSVCLEEFEVGSEVAQSHDKNEGDKWLDIDEESVDEKDEEGNKGVDL